MAAEYAATARIRASVSWLPTLSVIRSYAVPAAGLKLQLRPALTVATYSGAARHVSRQALMTSRRHAPDTCRAASPLCKLHRVQVPFRG